ncbi:MAG: hypothetical protein CMD92_10355 [Gammaproteobacteria bacterium]|nr:hypothetical protein [Gammaproteobacteria bacterium]
MPSTLEDKILIDYNNKKVKIDIYDTPLGRRFIEALKDNLEQKRILEKNFCFLGWADSKRDLNFLCGELNLSIEQINSFAFDPPYEKIHPFRADDFQYSDRLSIGKDDSQKGLRLKHDACNLLHRYFEELQGTAWQMSPFYIQSDLKTKYAIRQLNNICHEIESWVLSYRKTKYEPDWIRPSQITTFLNAPRYDLHQEDFELFKQNRYDRELGGVYLHWSQVGKTLYEVFRDEDGTMMDEATCSEINHQKYYSGEFDIEWGDTITEETHDFKKEEMDKYRAWLKENNYDWEDPKLSLGYIKIGQVDLETSFQNRPFTSIYEAMKDNLNIKNITIRGVGIHQNDFPYTLESDDWKQIQMEGLKRGYESRSMR